MKKSLYASPAIPKETARLSGPYGKNTAFGHSRRARSACCGSRGGRHSEDCPQRLGESRCGAFCSCAVRDHAAASARTAHEGFAAISDGLCRRRPRQASERPFLYAHFRCSLRRCPPPFAATAASEASAATHAPLSAPECIGLKKAGMRPAFLYSITARSACAHTFYLYLRFLAASDFFLRLTLGFS